MTESRYSNRTLTLNDHKMYRNILKNRGMKAITQFVTPKFITLPEPLRDLVEYDIIVWQIGGKYFKLADKHYGDPSLWWIIASFNLAPTEAHLDIGDTVYIPLNWELIYDYVRR